MVTQGVLYPTPPCDPQFSVDMDDVDPGGDCLPQIFLVGSRPAMQSKRDSCCALDFGNSRDIESLPCSPLYHALEHSVHASHGRSKEVDPGGLSVLFRFIGSC